MQNKNFNLASNFTNQRMPEIKKYVIITAGILFMIACREITEPFSPKIPHETETLDGPIEGLSTLEKQQFILGDQAFNDEIFSSETGLGPYFVATSCGSCHAGDGKGHPFTTLTRFGQYDSVGNMFLHLGGPQLQHRAIAGFSPEQIPKEATFSRFIPPAVTGLGYLAALSDAQILSYSDPEDQDGDGISGRPNWINPPVYFKPQGYHQSGNGRYIGRFGKKGAAIDLLHQTVNAYHQDMGITSDFELNEPAVYGVPYPYFDPVPDPEIAATTINHVVSYLRSLKAPVPRNQEDADVKEGKHIFMAIECGDCHTPEWTTPESDILALSHKTFYPYTDLLLHDMGSRLNDGYSEGSALPSEWRTPPLWGLGLSKNSSGGRYFLLHDGRAHSIEDAILFHGGEGENAKNQYLNLSKTQKDRLIKFLEHL